jgi:type IV pilus assembly protein PilA
MKLFRKEEGFTLVELMVVVLIIGILVAIAIPVFNAASASARKSACQSNLRTLDGATEQWVAANPDNDKATIDDLATAQDCLATADPGDGTSGIYVKDWAGSSTCPDDNNGAYGVTDGDFSCGGAGHNYE